VIDRSVTFGEVTGRNEDGRHDGKRGSCTNFRDSRFTGWPDAGTTLPRRERFAREHYSAEFRIHRDAFYSTAIGSIGFSRARSLSPYPHLRPCTGHALAPSLSPSRCEKILRDELPPSPSRGPATAMQFLIVGPSLLFPHRERHGFPCRAARYVNVLDRGEFKLSSCLECCKRHIPVLWDSRHQSSTTADRSTDFGCAGVKREYSRINRQNYTFSPLFIFLNLSL